ncbi:SH3 domain-containing protein [Shewanella algae]|uniref:SH3 domain-containing protein n=1 Tax=Shewanella algae TaxID=38313 RepID=UPI0031F52130
MDPEEVPNDKISSEERAKLLIEYWKQTSNVQQHFNDVSMKLRNFAVVVFSGFLTGIGLSIHNSIYIDINGHKVSAAVFFAIVGMIATQLIHFMDTYWYHAFLKGAVSSSTKIEEEIDKILGIESLSSRISKNSQKVHVLSIFGVPLPIGFQNTGCLNKIISTGKLNIFGNNVNVGLLKFFVNKKKTDSLLRHKIFYRGLLVIFLITILGMSFIPVGSDKEPVSDKKTIHELKFKQEFPLEFLPIELKINNESTEAIRNTSKLPKYHDKIISGDNVRVRTEGANTSEVLSLLPIGKKIEIVEDNQQSSWVKVKFLDSGSEVQGWIHREYVTTLKN